MYMIFFDKKYAEDVWAALRDQQPIPTPPGGFTPTSMLLLGGILYARTFWFGPQTHLVARIKTAELPLETQEASKITLNQDIHASLEFFADLTLAIFQGNYDEHFESAVEAIVFQEDEKQKITPVSGFKNMPNVL